jgi:hypothetical protein
MGSSLDICRRLTVVAPVSAGTKQSMQALTLQDSAMFDGETLLNRAYNGGTGKNLWNQTPDYPESVKINGLVSGCAVTPTITNNGLEVAAGVVNVSGVAVPVTADASTILTRPATAKYAIYAILVSSAGAVSALKGADGDALDWSGYGGAGQMPLCTAANAVIAYVNLYSGVAAVIDPSAISAGESANIAYDVDPIRGNVVLPEALPLSYAGPLRRPVYAEWYSQDGSVLQPIAELEECKITPKLTTLNVTPASARWERHVPGRSSFTVSVGVFLGLDRYMLDKVLTGGGGATMFIKARVNSTSADYFIGQVILTGTDLALKFGEVKVPFSLQGTGELCRIVG